MVSSQQEIKAVLQELELTRLIIAKQTKRAYFVVGFGLMLMLIAFALGLHEISIVVFFIALIAVIVMFSSSGDKTKQYRLAFKQRVIGKALHNFSDTLQFAPNSGISSKDFIESFLFDRRPDRYKTEDLVYGLIDKTKVHFAEVRAEYKTSDGKRTNWHTIFKGIIFCADFNKRFNGITVIRPKGFSIGFGKWIAKHVFNDNKTVELENPEFERLFLTQGNDQVEARYILTPSMMEKLIRLNQYANSTISVSFVWSNIYIAFPLNHNYFEAPIFKSLLDDDVLSKDIEILRLMHDVVAELDLNTRIWTKQ